MLCCTNRIPATCQLRRTSLHSLSQTALRTSALFVEFCLMELYHLLRVNRKIWVGLFPEQPFKEILTDFHLLLHPTTRVLPPFQTENLLSRTLGCAMCKQRNILAAIHIYLTFRNVCYWSEVKWSKELLLEEWCLIVHICFEVSAMMFCWTVILNYS